MTDRATRCFRCGRRTSSLEPVCEVCGACLLVDLVVDEKVMDSRSLHVIAREIDALGGEAPVFQDIKTGIALLPGVLLSQCNRHLAGRVAGILRRHGVVSREVPVRRLKGKNMAVAGPRVGAGFVATLRARIRRLPVAVTLTVAGVVAVVIVLGVLGGQRGGEVEDSSRTASGEPRLMSSREIAFAAIPASARLSCSGSIGAGFFIARDRLVTCAHILTSTASAIEVILADGRTLSGTLEETDTWLDLATVRVPGAEVAFLELGDATQAEQGETVLAVGSPFGLDFSVSQGVVSHPSRILMGLSYLQIDAVLHPGNSGGPILDRGGRVIGVAVTTAANPSGVGLVLPVNYLYSGESCLVQKGRLPGEMSRWKTVLERTSEAEGDELAEVLSKDSRPALISAGVHPDREVEVIVARVASVHPVAQRLDFTVVDNKFEVCRATGEVGWWQLLSERDGGVAASRYLSWLERHELLGQVFLGKCRLELGECPTSVAKPGVQLRLVGGDHRAHRVVVDSLGRW